MTLRSRGFTIVELLIVVVVIAILAAISVVAYNGIQSRANDSKIKAAATQVERAIQIYSAENGSFPTGLGYYLTNPTDNICTVSGGGWAARQAYGHTCTLEAFLNAQESLPTNFMFNLPRNKFMNESSGRYTLMFYRCTNVGPNYFVLFWYLESPSAQDIASYDTVTTQCAMGTTYRTSYGMQAARLIAT